jgi:hypothetical protein
MPRPAQTSIADIISSTIADAVRSITPTIQRRIAALAAEERGKGLARDGRSRRRVARARPRAKEMTKWVADRRARRVPTFVIEMTGGIDTKKKIVARYGDNAAFEKGKPPPKASK